MNDRQKKQSLKLEKTQAVERRNITRRVKQFFVLAIVSLPIILFLSGVLTKAGVNDAWSVVIFCVILVAMWCIMIFCDKLILKRAKKIRQIKNAQAVVDKYNAEVLKRREEELATKKQAEEKFAATEQAETASESEISQVEAEIETAEAQKNEPENKNDEATKNTLQNEPKNVIINNEEKKNKLKQKKYGGFNNKRKK